MMKFILYFFFMIPILFFDMWFLFQYLMMICMFSFIWLSVDYFMVNLSYIFGVDYVSYFLVILSFYIVMLMILSSIAFDMSSVFMFSCYIICFLLIFVFISLNLLIMYLSFELLLLPLMILILGLGYQPDRLSSSIYLFFYTLFGSLPLFIFIMVFYSFYNTLFFEFSFFGSSSFLFHLMMVLAFLVKAPMFMFHFWLPSAHVQAPISGSMILAGLMLSVGGYGLIRFMYLNEGLFYSYSLIWVSFSMWGGILVGLVSLIQYDMKGLIAYSSVCHMSLCLMGIFSMSKMGFLGSVIMMVSHGLCSSGLFCLCNLLYLRLMSRSFFLMSGLIFYMPSLSVFWFLFSLFNMSCPPSINFLGELYILMGLVSNLSIYIFYFPLYSFLSACFSFYLYSRSQHGSHMNFYSYSSVTVIEYLLVFNHLVPCILLFFLFMMFF